MFFNGNCPYGWKVEWWTLFTHVKDSSSYVFSKYIPQNLIKIRKCYEIKYM